MTDARESILVRETPLGHLSEGEVAQLEARNALLQFDEVCRIIEAQAGQPAPYRLRPSSIARLNRLAVADLEPDAGRYRLQGIEIRGSTHKPPEARTVDELVEDLCDHINDNWSESAIYLASFVMWRLNWIHPFSNGNGRTSRAVSYLVLCIRLGCLLPGTMTIPARIVDDRFPYYDALDSADAAWSEGRIDLTEMERLLSRHLAGQLMDLYKDAGGRETRPDQLD